MSDLRVLLPRTAMGQCCAMMVLFNDVANEGLPEGP